jgi:hypothetical protein
MKPSWHINQMLLKRLGDMGNDVAAADLHGGTDTVLVLQSCLRGATGTLCITVDTKISKCEAIWEVPDQYLV